MKSETVGVIAGYVFPLGLLAMLGTPLIWAYQLFHWLRWGDWLGISVSEALKWAGLGTPHFSWAGVQTVSDLLMATPFSIAWFFLTLGLLVGFSEWSEAHEKKHASSAIPNSSRVAAREP